MNINTKIKTIELNIDLMRKVKAKAGLMPFKEKDAIDRLISANEVIINDFRKMKDTRDFDTQKDLFS